MSGSVVAKGMVAGRVPGVNHVAGLMCKPSARSVPPRGRTRRCRPTRGASVFGPGHRWRILRFDLPLCPQPHAAERPSVRPPANLASRLAPLLILGLLAPLGCEEPPEESLTFGLWSVSFTERSDSTENVLKVGEDKCLMEVELGAAITRGEVEWELADPFGTVRWSDSAGVGDTTIVFKVSDPLPGEWRFIVAKDSATGSVSTDTRIPLSSWSEGTGRANSPLQADVGRQRFRFQLASASP